MPWRLLVVDGADADRFFPLPEAGTVIIGNSHKHADLHLHDLLVARVHCQVDSDGDRVMVTAMASDKETRVNGQIISTHEMLPGEILRVGNSHIRLEWDDGRNEVVDGGEGEGFEEVQDEEVVYEIDPLPEVGWDLLHKLSGHTLGHFEIGPLLGRGHTAVTFRARDTKARREVALKVISPDFPANPEELQQFARTIKKVATIRDPNLVTWYAAGRTNRCMWIAQELVEGESLAQVLKRGQTASVMLKWRNALKLGHDLAKALKSLAERKMVHGNLTPANVLIALDRTAKLNDLMYEDSLRGSEWHNQRIERKFLAELPYMAPERLEEGAYWDAGADIYGLGALVYARLTSMPPFKGDSAEEMIDAIRAGRFEPPRKIIRGCPEPFEAAVLKMMAVNQEDRYQSPAKLLDDLEGMNTTL